MVPRPTTPMVVISRAMGPPRLVAAILRSVAPRRPPPYGPRCGARHIRAPARGATADGRRRSATGVGSRTMRLVVARCSVDYAGRLTAHLPLATRVLIVKADGSVLVHSDGGSYKPLNWMSPPCTLVEGDGQWTVTNKAGETLTI